MRHAFPSNFDSSGFGRELARSARTFGVPGRPRPPRTSKRRAKASVDTSPSQRARSNASSRSSSASAGAMSISVPAASTHAIPSTVRTGSGRVMRRWIRTGKNATDSVSIGRRFDRGCWRPTSTATWSGVRASERGVELEDPRRRRVGYASPRAQRRRIHRHPLSHRRTAHPEDLAPYPDHEPIGNDAVNHAVGETGTAHLRAGDEGILSRRVVERSPKSAVHWCRLRRSARHRTARIAHRGSRRGRCLGICRSVRRWCDHSPWARSLSPAPPLRWLRGQ